MYDKYDLIAEQEMKREYLDQIREERGYEEDYDLELLEQELINERIEDRFYE